MQWTWGWKADRGVTEQRLDVANVGAHLQQVRREGVAKRVRRGALAQPRCLHGRSDGRADAVRRDRPGRVLAWEEERQRRAGGRPVASKGDEKALRKHRAALAIPLAVADVEDTARRIDIGDAKRACLADAQPRAIHHQGHRPEHRVAHGAEHLRDLAAAEHERQLHGLPRPRHPRHDVGLAERHGVEEPEPRHLHLEDRRAALALLSQMLDVAAYLLLPHPLGRLAEMLGEAPYRHEVLRPRPIGIAVELEILFHPIALLCHRRSPLSGDTGHGAAGARRHGFALVLSGAGDPHGAAGPGSDGYPALATRSRPAPSNPAGEAGFVQHPQLRAPLPGPHVVRASSDGRPPPRLPPEAWVRRAS